MARWISHGLVAMSLVLPVSTFGQTLLHTLVSPNEEYAGFFGHSVSGAGDVDGDGFSDLIVGAYGEEPGSSPEEAGRAHVFSGADGSLLYTLVSPNEEQYGLFGWSVSGAGDVDGDGYADVIVGAHGKDPGSSPQDAGRAYVFSGVDGSLLYTLVSPNEEGPGRFGVSVSGVGDVDGDGHGDVIVGADLEDPGSSPSGAGRAYVFSGADGTVLHTLVSPHEEDLGFFGRCVSGVGDVNGDGHPDVIVGAYQESPGSSPFAAGRAYVFSGADGSLLYTLASPNEQEFGYFGHFVSGAGDVDGDGRRDVIVRAFWENPGSSPEYAGRSITVPSAPPSLPWATWTAMAATM